MKTQTKIFQKKIDRIAIGSKVNNEALEISKTIASLKDIVKSLDGSSPVQVLAMERLIDNLVIVHGNLKDVFSEMNCFGILEVVGKKRKHVGSLIKVTKTHQSFQPAPTKVLKKGKS
jgi:hypothetical protein